MFYSYVIINVVYANYGFNFFTVGH